MQTVWHASDLYIGACGLYFYDSRSGSVSDIAGEFWINVVVFALRDYWFRASSCYGNSLSVHWKESSVSEVPRHMGQFSACLLRQRLSPRSLLTSVQRAHCDIGISIMWTTIMFALSWDTVCRCIFFCYFENYAGLRCVCYATRNILIVSFFYVRRDV